MLRAPPLQQQVQYPKKAYTISVAIPPLPTITTLRAEASFFSKSYKAMQGNTENL
jgi:hypothetical protein